MVPLHDHEPPTPSPLHKLPGGATRSEQKPMYHLVPMAGPRRTALRFTMGAAVHGPSNWKRSLQCEANAAAFCQEAYNHMMEHAYKMAQGLEPLDDHLGAIGWAQSVLCYAEELFGKRWIELDPEKKDRVLP